MTARHLFAAVLVLALSADACAGDGSLSEFRKANEAYRAKEFPKALGLYRSIGERVRNPVLFYNWGNAAFKSGRLGEALLAMEKAHRLAPRDADIRSNLRFFRERVKDSLPEEDQDFVSRFLLRALDSLSLNELATAVFVLVWVACLLASGFILYRGVEHRGLMAGLLIGSVVLLSVTLVPFLAKLYVEVSREMAIVLAPEIQILSGPGADEIKRFTLHEGTRVLVVKDWDKWVHISLPNGENGWTLAEKIGKI